VNTNTQTRSTKCQYNPTFSTISYEPLFSYVPNNTLKNMMIFNNTPIETWNPWNPVIKKNKLANVLCPYSFLIKLAPSTTYLKSATLAKVSSLDKTIFSCALSGTVYCVLILIS